MNFLADMCVDVRIVQWLLEQGHDAIHLREQGLHRMPNGEIFDKAIYEDRIVITFDLDFAEIASLTKGKKVSVILFRLRNTRSYHVIERLSVVLKESLNALQKGAIVVVEESRHRVRYLPIGEI